MRKTSHRQGNKAVRAGLCVAASLAMLAVMIPAQSAGAASPQVVWSPLVGPNVVGNVATWTLTAVENDPDFGETGPNAELLSVTCNPPSGSAFPVGTTTVTCTATDLEDGDVGPGTTHFDVVIAAPDTDLAISAGVNPAPVPATGPLGAQVNFALPVATDEDGSVAVTCNPPSGSWFAPGATTVTCSATDPDDTPSTVQTSFTVTVTDADLVIAPGADPSPVVATSPAGAKVDFAPPIALDEDGSVAVTCNPASGSVFVVGKTTVTCSATDSDDTPSTVQTTLTVTVYAFPTVPSAPLNVTASSLDAGALVVFGAPWDLGGYPVDSGNATCVSSNGGTSGSASGDSPVTVTGLTNGRTYTCTVTATNHVGTGPPSDRSNTVVPGGTTAEDICTNVTVCKVSVPTGLFPNTAPQQTTATGTPTDAIGTLKLASGAGTLACPNSAQTNSPVTRLDETGFSDASAITMIVKINAFGPVRVCFGDDQPFLSDANPTFPQAGTGNLLLCSKVANVLPCVDFIKNGSVKFRIRGHDPVFRLVLPPGGRLLWPSAFPVGKVGSAYAARLQSSGGKAPYHWKIASGKLAAGLALNGSTGAITGKPKAKGTFSCLVQATDSESPPKSAKIVVSITIK